MDNQLSIETLKVAHTGAIETKYMSARGKEGMSYISKTIFQHMVVDFELNPSADNFSRMILAAETYQQYVKNVKIAS